MALAPGTKLGPYDVLSPLGAGGMGEVYRARDTRLGRDVAIKVLPDHLASDPKALRRFETEARAVAALSHPNILALHDVGETNGVHYAVTELLEGETLRALIGRGPVLVKRALEIAHEVAEALAAAHEKGIVHRDVKPENVFMTKDGHAKLLDFGLARVTAGLGADAGDTRSLGAGRPTDGASIVGTVAYMSPEQSKGVPVDFRSDQFAFGVVLYEMVAGRRPFRGATVAETITAILREEPEPLEMVAPGVPPPVRWIVERCLAKEPAERFAATSDLVRDLATCRQHLLEVSSRAAGAPVEARSPRGRTARIAALSALAATAALALFAAGVLFERSAGRKPAEGGIPRLVRLTWEPGQKRFPSVSPDGASFAYASGPPGRTDILVRRIGGENPVNLTKDCPEEDTMPAFSPDGQSIAFRSGRQGGGLFVMGATGENVRRLTDVGFEPAWSPDGKSIAFSTDRSETGMASGIGEIWIVDVAGGARRKLFDGDALHPSWSPSGSRIAFHRRRGAQVGTALSTISVSGGPATNLAEMVGSLPSVPTWTRDGIWFASSDLGIPSIWRVRVDEATGARVGPPERVVASTLQTWYPTSTPDGRRLLFASFESHWSLVRYAFDPVKGRVLPEPHVILSGPRHYCSPRPSPDGEWLATLLFDRDTQDLVLVRTSTGETRRLTNDALREDCFAWAQDGTRIYFSVAPGAKGEIWSIRADGSGRERVATAPDGGDLEWPIPSPDGRWLYAEVGATNGLPCLVDLHLPPGERRPVPLPPMSETLRFGAGGRAVDRRWIVGAWSPDGRWLVGFPHDPAGKAEPVVTLFDLERRTYRALATLEAMSSCAWLPDSRRILLWRKGELRILDRETGSLSPAGSVGEDFRGLRLSADGRTLVGDTVSLDGDIWMREDAPAR